VHNPQDPKDHEQFIKGQLNFIDIYADLRPDRATEILAQLGVPYAFWASITYLRPDRMPRTLELIDTALRLAVLVEMRFKHALAVTRPIEYSPQVQPMILTPGHGSLPSGHSTEAHIIARVLTELVDSSKLHGLEEQLMAQAARIAVNRTVAGVHFPMDSTAGRVLGITLAEYFLARANTSFYLDRTYHGAALTVEDGNRDFEPNEQINKGDKVPPKHIVLGEFRKVEVINTLAWLWDEAKKEWERP
jgi:membrane-associated phospholipid phosphatase